MPNGYLSLEGLNGVGTWTVVRAGPDQVQGLAGILSAKRVRIDRRDIELSVPRDSIVLRPFHLQFVAFPCGAPTVPRKEGMKVQIVSLSVDLPPAIPTEPVRFSAPGFGENEIMPLR